MKMSTKEELMIENTRLKDKLALYRKINHRQACIIKESLELNKPCQEYALYEPQPYKLVDLKPKMWVWCENLKVFKKVLDKRYSCVLERYEVAFYPMSNPNKYSTSRVWEKFEENSFFPVTKAIQYQG